MVKFKGLLFSFILAFGIVASRSIPSFASAYVIDPSTIGSIGDLGLGLLGGAEFDFTGSKYQIKNYDSLSQADKIDAAIGATNEFIDDYWSARKEYIKANNGFLQESNKVYDNYALKNAGLLNTDTNFHISGQLATDWMQYSRYWYKDYASSLDIESDAPSPNPDPDFSFISNINNLYQEDGINLMSDTFQLYDGSSPWDFGTGSIKNTTICSDNFVYYGSHTGGLAGITPIIYSLDNICTIIITINQDDSVSVSYSTSSILQHFIYQSSNPNIYRNAVTIQEKKNANNAIEINPFAYSTVYFSGSPYNRSSFDSISTCINYIYRHYCNVNIYVNSEPWVLVGDAPANPVIPDFPDIIGTDDDPIYTFDLPDTSNYEGSFDITSLFDAIKEAIIGASDTDNSTSGVLTGENVSDLVVDDTGTLVGTKAIPISTVLDDSIEGEATKRLPNIELYPDKIHDAFSGTTLLADIILATQESLPSAIVVVFWGIVICLIIIALIKSLHR